MKSLTRFGIYIALTVVTLFPLACSKDFTIGPSASLQSTPTNTSLTTATPTSTNTTVFTNTPTHTVVPPTNTSTFTFTPTASLTPTGTSTNTPILPTLTFTAVASFTPTATETNTLALPTSTPTDTFTFTAVGSTPTITSTPTPCQLNVLYTSITVLGVTYGISDSQIIQLINGSPIPVLVVFCGANCPICTSYEPVVKQFAMDYGCQVMVLHVNCDDNPGLGTTYGIQYYPTTKFFRNGSERAWMLGYHSEATLAYYLSII